MEGQLVGHKGAVPEVYIPGTDVDYCRVPKRAQILASRNWVWF
jgi:hypothetical protein